MPARIVLTGAALGAALLAVGGRVVGAQRPPAREFWADARVVALADAAARGDAAGVKAAKAAGADPNAVGKDGMLPLLYTMIAKNHAGMRALLAVGADPNAPGPRDFPLLPSAAKADDPELLRILLDGGANPSAKGPSKEPLLHSTVYQRRWDNLHTLVERGADVDGLDSGHGTAVLLCARLGYWDQVAYLLEHRADPSIPDLAGATLPYKVDQRFARTAGSGEASLRRVRDLLAARGVKFPAETPTQVRTRVFGADGSPNSLAPTVPGRPE